ncbi:LA_3334 family protein [Leptospira sp. 'Mane']|uniref:LA_3334 family protein n=1 Tax=Leptospira sp. 'Mane' TaxID=3387407 RepID=UPI00398B7685
MFKKVYDCYLVNLLQVFVGIFATLPLFSAELRFPNGEVFQTEFVYEDERILSVRFRGKEYKVPKKNLESYDLSKKSSSVSSYKLSSFVLKDGSSIRGTIAEEKANEYTIKTEIGFLTLLKSELKPPYPVQSAPPDFPEEYRSTDKETNQTKVGLSFNYLPTLPPLSQSTPALIGGSIFVEPAFLRITERWQTGFKYEYQTSRNLTIHSGYTYFLYSKQLFDNPILDFYTSIGLGVSQAAFKAEGSNLAFTGTNSLVNWELGWQGLKISKSFYRIGWKNQCFIEEKGAFCGSGIEISGGWAF